MLAWLTNTPTLTIELNSAVVPFASKNPDLLIIFMGGWAKYSILNNHSTDLVQCSKAGIRSAMNVYEKGMGIKKDKNMERLVQMDFNNQLEDWLRKELNKENDF